MEHRIYGLGFLFLGLLAVVLAFAGEIPFGLMKTFYSAIFTVLLVLGGIALILKD